MSYDIDDISGGGGGDPNIQGYLIQLNYYIIGLGGLLMFCIGIITNILNLIVFSRRSMKSTTNKYLTALAICDIFVLIFSQLITSNSFINDYNDTTDTIEDLYASSYFLSQQIIPLSVVDFKNETAAETNTIQTTKSYLTSSQNIRPEKSYLSKLYYSWSLTVYPRIYPFAYPFAILFQIATVWINVGMSIDRFVAIHFPLRSLKYCTISNAKRIIKFIFLFAVLYSLPRFFEYHTIVNKIKLNTHNNNNETIEMIFFEHTKVGQSKAYKMIVYFWMYLLFQSVVPLILLALINFSLVYSVKTSGKFVNRLNSNFSTRLTKIKSKRMLKIIYNKEKTRKETTIMLISVVILFICLHTPSVICNFMHSLNHDKEPSVRIIALCYVGNFLIITNSSTNFFTYCLFNRRFRQELTICVLKLCCKSWYLRYKKRKRLSVSISYNNFLHNIQKFEKKRSTLVKINVNGGQKTNAVYYANNQVKILCETNENLLSHERNSVRSIIQIDKESKAETSVFAYQNVANCQNLDESYDDTDKMDSDNNDYNIIANNELTESNLAYV